MDRLFTFWRAYCMVEQEARTLVQQHGQVLTFGKGTYYIQGNEIRPYWCFILEGLVASRYTLPSGKQIIDWIYVANEYFTGTKHPFSRHAPRRQILFLQDTKVVQLPNSLIQYAQQHFISASELIQTLKQKEIDRRKDMTFIRGQDSKTEAYIAFRKAMPQLAQQLKVADICAFLQMDRSSYYRALAVYLRLY